MTDKTEVAVWKQEEFEGTSLIPAAKSVAYLVNPQALVGRENVEIDDLLVPSLALLQGQSDAVTSGVPGAVPGLFMQSNTGDIMKPPLKAIVVHYHKTNGFFPQHDKYPESKDKQRCLSRDGIKGTVYGNCEECGICTTWMPDGRPPMGAENHIFTVITDKGPATLRFSRSSYKPGSKFLSNWNFGSESLWDHPVVIRVVSKPKQLDGGKMTTYQTMTIGWTDEDTPEGYRQACLSLYNRINKKHEAGEYGDEMENVGDFE